MPLKGGSLSKENKKAQVVASSSGRTETDGSGEREKVVVEVSAVLRYKELIENVRRKVWTDCK